MRKSLVKAISTVFFIGYSNFIPGTLASLAAFLVYAFFIRDNAILHLVLVAAIIMLGFWVSSEAEGIFNKKDARQIVIDDFAGMLGSLLFLPYSLKLGLAGFFVFRVMDGLKPYPIYKIERLHRAWGVMGDDLVAGIYVNITLQLLVRLISLNFS